MVFRKNKNNRYLFCSSCDAGAYTISFPNLYLGSGVFGTTGVASSTYDGRAAYKFVKANAASTEIGAVWFSGSSSSSPGTIMQAQWGSSSSGKIWLFNNVQNTAPSPSVFNITTWSCPSPTCSVVADICLVFDESGSIGTSNFQLAKNFGVNISLSYTWAANGLAGIYMAFIAFADSPRVVFNWTNSEGNAINYLRNVICK